jgi:hypothetical protein
MSSVLDPDLANKVSAMVGPALAPHIERLGQASLFNLYCALAAMGHQGPSGIVTLQVPAKVADRIEIDWQPLRNTRVL